MSVRPWKIAILDDYQNVAFSMADWSRLDADAAITVYNDHLDEPDRIVERLEPFDIVCVMRERTPLPRAILERLPSLRVIVSTGPGNASIDRDAAKALGIEIFNTGYWPTPAIELTWALILASMRHIVTENEALRAGGWQQAIGDDLAGSRLGLVGLGHIGAEVGRIGKAFGMDVIAWSQNLTEERAADAGVRRVDKVELFASADVISVHLVLSERTRGLIGAPEFGLMKPSARLVNTSRGPIVIEADLIEALRSGRIAGAAIDVFDREPLPTGHPLRTAPRLLATPHIGYVSRALYERFFQDTVDNIAAWISDPTHRPDAQ